MAAVGGDPPVSVSPSAPFLRGKPPCGPRTRVGQVRELVSVQHPETHPPTPRPPDKVETGPDVWSWFCDCGISSRREMNCGK